MTEAFLRVVAGVHKMNLTTTTAEFWKLMIMEDVAVEEIVVVGGVDSAGRHIAWHWSFYLLRL